MRYGVPYKGSKNGIAEWIYSHFPKRTNFYDLFCGGCAILQVALMRQEYKNYFCNDIDGGGIELFLNAIYGKYKNENRWIDRTRLRRQRMKVDEPERYAQLQAKHNAYLKEWHKRKRGIK